MSCTVSARGFHGARVLKPAIAFLAMMLALPAVALAKPNPKYAAIVVDGNTGKVLHADHADSRRYPASLTKIMTLYILFDYLKKGRITYNTKFYVTPHAAAQPPSKLGLKAGDYIRVYDLIGALVTKSANDAAATVAENIAGSEAKFARLMNARARALGMKHTTYRNASGLPDPGQMTTARDMALLSLRIMNDFPKYSTFFKTRVFRYHGKRFRNHNHLLFSYRGMEGIKTGYTRASGFNLTTSVRRGNKHLIAVVLGGRSAKRRNVAMAQLLNKNLPQAIAMRKKRPLTQRIAQLDPNGQIDTTASTNGIKVWTRPARPNRTAMTTARLIGKPPAADKFSRRYSSAGYDIQIGSYQDRQIAVGRLSSAMDTAHKLLGGHQPYVMAFEKDGVQYHRARFAGFSSRTAASSTCSRLKKQYRYNCIVMTP